MAEGVIDGAAGQAGDDVVVLFHVAGGCERDGGADMAGQEIGDAVALCGDPEDTSDQHGDERNQGPH